MRRAVQAVLTAAPALLLPGLALAHTGVGASHGLGAGLAHPLLGLDHLLAMVAVGVWAATLGGRALWLVPAAFVGTMLLGGMLGMAGIGLPAVELMIAGSLVALGAAIAFELRLPAALGMALVAGFALFHGAAHGAELPTGADGLGYALGFVLATAALHALGIGIGRLAGRGAARPALRVAGASVAAVGVLLLAGI